MPPRSPQEQPTTEEHQPPQPARAARGQPILLAAFPTPAAVPLPAAGAPAGRAWLADAGIVDPKISGNHFRIARDRGRLTIEDATSRNGTFVDGHRLTPGERAPLEDGAVLRVGSTLFVYREAFAGPLAPEPPLGRLVAPFGLTALRADLARLAARPALNVLIQGETGSGKELLAEEVVRVLGRPARLFCRINVAGIAATLFEGQLFGWKRGAFSGSSEESPGVIRKHDGGAVFLDEIGELHPDLQPKLLRLIENREVLPVGATHPVHVDVALIAATNRRLEDQVTAGDFRRDLLARFVVRLALPPLRDRPEDLFAITQALWQGRHGPLDPARTPVHVEVVEQMMLHDWPANVRDVDRLVTSLDPAEGLTEPALEPILGPRAAAPARTVTREAIQQALDACGGNKSQAAKQLGISRGYLIRQLAGPKPR